MILLLDSNTISDFLSRQTEPLNQMQTALAEKHSLALCRPVHYEVLRGLLWRDALSKRQLFDRSIGSLFS